MDEEEIKMKNKLLLSVLGVSMLSLMMAGCGSSAKETSTKEEPAATTEVTAEATTDTTEESAATAEGSDESLEKIKANGVLKVGCKTDVPCFGMQNTSTGEYEGLEIDLAYAIAGDIFDVTPEEAKEKKLVEFQGVTAKTRGPLLDSGELDLVIATFTITDERKEQWNFSTPYIEDALGLMCLTSSGYQSMNDIDGAIIGVAQGSTTKDVIEQYISENNLPVQVEFEEFDGYPALSAALSSGNIDIFSVDRAILAGYNDETTMILPERFGVQEYGVASALNNKALAAEVDSVVSELLTSGKMDEMIRGWGIE